MSRRAISFHYTLTDSDGEVLDSSAGDSPLTFLEGGDQIIPGLESVLVTLNVGDKRKVSVVAAEAYGDRNDELILSVPLEQFGGQEIEVGDQFQTGDFPAPFTVTGIEDSQVILDGNHPLAGVDLTFDIEMIEIRPATTEELEHGHVHGPGGHHH